MKGQLEFGEYVENPVLCRYNKIRIFGWHNNLIKNEDGKITGVLSSAEDITDSIMLREELEATNQKLSDLTNHIQKLREDERSKLAREIHDDLGQSLTALKLDLTAARNDLKIQPDKSAKRINSALDLTNTTIQTVQEITSELRPGLIDDLGLIPAIEWYTNQFAERSGIDINTKLNFSEENFVEEHKIVIYRIIQESLTNVARHSGATKATVKLRRQDNNLELTIKDNGKGISEEQKLKSNSFGLIGMNERADAINGSIYISGESGKGTKIKLLVPLKRK